MSDNLNIQLARDWEWIQFPQLCDDVEEWNAEGTRPQHKCSNLAAIKHKSPSPGNVTALCTKHAKARGFIKDVSPELPLPKPENVNCFGTREEIIARYKSVCSELSQRNRTIKIAGMNNVGVWVWQGDGEDHVESLVCPVLISADKMRKIQEELSAAKKQIEMMRAADKAMLESDSIIASCNCQTKSPDIKYHMPGCKYRLIEERNALRENVDALNRTVGELESLASKWREFTLAVNGHPASSSPSILAKQYLDLKQFIGSLKPGENCFVCGMADEPCSVCMEYARLQARAENLLSQPTELKEEQP